MFITVNMGYDCETTAGVTFYASTVHRNLFFVCEDKAFFLVVDLTPAHPGLRLSVFS